MNYRKIGVLFFSAILSLVPIVSWAADSSNNLGEWANEILKRVLNLLIWPFLFGASIVMFIFAGFLFLTAQGDPSKVQRAVRALLWATIGLAIAILGFSSQRIIYGILYGP